MWAYLNIHREFLSSLKLQRSTGETVTARTYKPIRHNQLDEEFDLRSVNLLSPDAWPAGENSNEKV